MNPVRPCWIWIYALKNKKTEIILYRFASMKGGLTG